MIFARFFVVVLVLLVSLCSGGDVLMWMDLGGKSHLVRRILFAFLLSFP